MKVFEISTPKKDCNCGYTSIYDDGFFNERKLIIKDDEGNTVTLKNEQIGKLYRTIKPAMAG